MLNDKNNHTERMLIQLAYVHTSLNLVVVSSERSKQNSRAILGNQNF